jgi:microcystin-dependent protein
MRLHTLQSGLLTVVAPLVILLAVTLNVESQSVPPLVNYQGRLTDQDGAPLPPGSYTIQFKLWDDPLLTNAADLVWAQQQSVTLQSNGVFDVILGSSAGISIPGLTPMANSLSLAFTQSNRFLGATVVSTNSAPIPYASEILPRQQLLASPYAFSSGTAVNAVNAVNGVPAGTILPYGGTAAPFGFLLCDGSSCSSGVYSNLFAAIGTIWGTGRGTNNFSVPDFRGRTLFGAGGGGVSTNGNPLTARAVGQNGGEETHQLTIAEMPSHSHNISGGNDWVNNGFPTLTGPTPNLGWIQPTLPTGGNQPHNTMPPFAVVSYIIKY